MDGDEDLKVEAAKELAAKRLLLFKPSESGKPVHLTDEQFDEIWPYCDNIYNTRSSFLKEDGKIRVSLTEDEEGKPVKLCRAAHFTCRLAQKRQREDVSEDAPISKRNLTQQTKRDCPGGMMIHKTPAGYSIHITKAHDHKISENDLLKRSSHCADVVRALSRQGIDGKTIYRILVLEPTLGTTHNMVTGLDKTDIKEIHNWMRGNRPQECSQYAARSGPDLNSARAFSQLELLTDIADARAFLGQAGYTHGFQRIPADKNGNHAWVIALANADEKEALEKFGNAFQFDGCASTNIWEATLSTLVVQTSSGAWVPGGHLILSEETGATIKAGVEMLKGFCPRWRHHYALIDDSLKEANGLRAALPGLHIFLCTVHTNRAIFRKLAAHKDAKRYLHRAMHRYTEQSCIDDVQRAINSVHSFPKKKNYIRKRFMPEARRQQWALYARQHSPWLMQNTATQAVEGAWHRELRRRGSSKRHGLRGLVRVLDKAVQLKFRVAKKRQWKATHRTLRAAKGIPYLSKFPLLMQHKIIRQKRLAQLRNLAGKSCNGNFQGGRCFCLFFRRYVCPCQHMFHHDMENPNNKFLTKPVWKSFAETFEEGGMEVYTKHARVFVPSEPQDARAAELETRTSDFREAQEVLENVFWRLQEHPEASEKTAALLAALKETASKMSLASVLN